MRVKIEVKTEPSCLADSVATSGRALRPMLASFVPEHWAVRISVEVVAVAMQVLPFRFVQA